MSEIKTMKMLEKMCQITTFCSGSPRDSDCMRRTRVCFSDKENHAAASVIQKLTTLLD